MENVKPVIELELYLVRHGQSKGNVNAFTPEDAEKEINDPHLTELGIMQAKKAGKYLQNVEFDACYSSALIRTVQTANEIMNFQKEKKVLNVLPLVTEVGVTEAYIDRTIEEIREGCETAQVAEGFENAEKLVIYSSHAEEEALYERAEKAISYLRSRYNQGEKVLVAGHAAFNTVMIFHVMGYSASPVFDIEITNTGITHVIFYKAGTNKFGDIVFDSINDTKHFCIKDEEVTDVSVSDLIAANPENIDSAAERFAYLLKEIHSQKEDGTDIKPGLVEKTDEIMHFIPVEKWQKLRSLITAVENSGTKLQVNCNTDAAFLGKGKLEFKDFGKKYIGYPVFDLGNLYENLIASSEIDRSEIYKTSGFTFETAERFWEKVINLYFEGEKTELIERAKDRARLMAYFNIFYRLIARGKTDSKEFPYYKEKFIEHINRCGSLDFE